MPKQQIRVPASPAVVKDLIPEILASEGALKRSEITARLRQLLPSRGFTYNASASVFTTKRALSLLLAEGRINSPRTGWYEVPENSTAVAEDSDPQEELSSTDELSPIEPATSKLKIEREIGEGPESVYVYFHDVYFELSQRKGMSTWECKVGRTVGDPDARIMGQGALTCFPRCPVIGLVIRTHDGRNLERLLQAALSYAGARINNGAGSEWFLTSPDLVEQWFLQFKGTLKILKGEGTAS
jgi:T5orf172 domain